MTEPTIDLKPTTDRMAALLDGIADEQLTARTPNEGRTVATLLDHAMGLTLAFTNAATKSAGPLTDTGPQPSADELDPEWRRELPCRLTFLADVWRDPAAWEGEATAGGVTLPAAVMGLVALNEVAIHGWDLARATGQPYDLDKETLDLLLPFVGADADDQAAREGLYAPVVPVPDDAPPLDRLIGLTGRDPAWR